MKSFGEASYVGPLILFARSKIKKNDNIKKVMPSARRPVQTGVKSLSKVRLKQNSAINFAAFSRSFSEMTSTGLCM
jgi:hypothetical protein